MKEAITWPLSQICTYKTRVALETHTWYPTKCSQNTLPAQTLSPHVSCLYQFKSCEVPQQITDSCSARAFQGDLCIPPYPELSASVTVSIRVKSYFFNNIAIKDKTSWCLEKLKQTAFQHLQGSMVTQESYYNRIHTPQVIKLTFFVRYRNFYFLSCYLCSSSLS